MEKIVLPYTITKRISEHARSRVEIVCPFCNTKVWAYIWSLAGSGKKCPKCGAIHTCYYGTVKREE
jgi:uncharacterized radical SAM superfamily Fe-S cluster-containing enzyme